MAESRRSYTKRTERVLALAEDEARRLQHAYIGQEHILLGLLREEDGVAAYLLADFGVTPERVREVVIAMVGPGAVPPTRPPMYTPRARRTLELAGEQAELFGHQFVGTEHLLLGLLAEGTGMGVKVLAEFDVTLERAQGALRRLEAEGARGPRGVKGLASQLIERQRGVRRYSLVLPEDLFQQVQQLAEAEQTTVVELLRRFTRLGLLVHEIQRTPGSSLIIRQPDNSEQRLVVL